MSTSSWGNTEEHKALLYRQYATLIKQKNQPGGFGNGLVQRWHNPVITRDHVPLHWRYDLNPTTNPYLMERIGVNATFNAGAIYWQGKFIIVVRIEGNDRKSFFAIAESDNGVDGFTFWDRPVNLPAADATETNVYDMRLTAHEDGYIYGVFCAESRDLSQPDDLSAAIAHCGIARTQDLIHWQRLANLTTPAEQQRNVVLHSEFIDGHYAFYTRPQDSFIEAGGAGGISWGLSATIDNATIDQQTLIDPRIYHTINEAKNGLGPPPVKTESGWLHLAHGVRNTAAGLRYVLYVFITDLNRPWKIIHKPAGYFMAAQASERVGDVSNVLFSNGWISNDQGKVFIYYASSDTRLHVATTTITRLLNYCRHTPEDGLCSAQSVRAINTLIDNNQPYLPATQ